MKFKYTIILVLFVVFLSISTASANSINLIKKHIEPEVLEGIRCFDVNMEYIAIGFNTDRIDIYSRENFEYLYSYSFHISGGYSFDLDNNLLRIIDYRAKKILVFDDGHLNSIMENLDITQIHQDNLTRETVIIGDILYKLSRESGKSIIIKEIDGNEFTIFTSIDNSNNEFSSVRNTAIIIMILFIMLNIVVLVAYITIKQNKKKQK